MTRLIGLPKQAFFVRKRWDGQRLSLIHLTRIVDISPFTEAVWDCMDGVRDLDAIGGCVAAFFPDLDPNLREALVAQNIVQFAEQQLLEED